MAETLEALILRLTNRVMVLERDIEATAKTLPRIAEALALRIKANDDAIERLARAVIKLTRALDDVIDG